MFRFVLDTNKLINFWKEKGSQARTSELSLIQAQAWGRELAENYADAGIVTPIVIEYLCGCNSQDELRLAEQFLNGLPILDRGEVPVDDWLETRRIVTARGAAGQSTRLADGLIRAIATRLNLDVITDDRKFPAG